MKKTLISFLLLTVTLSAQNKMTFGVIGSQFENLGSGQKLTKIDKPFGYGFIFGYHLDKNISFALTSEYVNGNLTDNSGKENDIRLHISAFLSPINYKYLRAYISTGFVYSHREYEYNTLKDDESKSFFNGRFGLGLDYKFYENIFLNLDFGFYNDGLMLSGWSSSIGLRFIPNIF